MEVAAYLYIVPKATAKPLEKLITYIGGKIETSEKETIKAGLLLDLAKSDMRSLPMPK
jgi:hypothetical protein